jgi:hypothetical protein
MVDCVGIISKQLSIRGWPSGTAADSEDTVAFAKLQGVKCKISKFVFICLIAVGCADKKPQIQVGPSKRRVRLHDEVSAPFLYFLMILIDSIRLI